MDGKERAEVIRRARGMVILVENLRNKLDTIRYEWLPSAYRKMGALDPLAKRAAQDPQAAEALLKGISALEEEVRRVQGDYSRAYERAKAEVEGLLPLVKGLDLGVYETLLFGYRNLEYAYEGFLHSLQDFWGFLDLYRDPYDPRWTHRPTA